MLLIGFCSSLENLLVADFVCELTIQSDVVRSATVLSRERHSVSGVDDLHSAAGDQVGDAKNFFDIGFQGGFGVTCFLTQDGNHLALHSLKLAGACVVSGFSAEEVEQIIHKPLHVFDQTALSQGFLARLNRVHCE